jgi:hypothetical protein
MKANTDTQPAQQLPAPPAQIVLLDCGHTLPEKYTQPGHTGGTGYATTQEGKRICYACATAQQVEQLKDRSRPFVAYVGEGGKTITDWTGGHLMNVVERRPCKLTRPSNWHGKDFATYWGKDVHGGLWMGRGSPHIAIKMRPVKG